jgi:dTDP-4-amino-4,6-dideoxygalactose transaminase
MIKYIQKKQIDFTSIQQILSESIQLNHFTNRGPAKYALENELEKILKIEPSKKVICVANGTLALHALMLFYEKNLKRKIKWVTPSFTFPSSVVGKFNASIVDIDLETYTIPFTNQNLNKFDGFIITNLFGTYPSNINEWIEECKKREKILIFDNASSPLSCFNKININNFGDAAFGSLHHTKYLGFGEGGFIVINKEYYDEINSILGFGFDMTSTKRIYNKHSSNFKMSDTSAAFILQHIINYDINKHIKIQNYLIESLKDKTHINIFNLNDDVVYGNLPLISDKKINNLFFRDKGIECHKYYYPLKSHKNSLNIYNKIINFPLHSGLTDYEIENMLNIIKGNYK